MSNIDERSKHQRDHPKAPDYMKKLQNIKSNSRLVGDGSLRKVIKRGTNADLDDFSPYTKRGQSITGA